MKSFGFTTYTVKRLTGMNVKALRAALSEDPRLLHVGETVATFRTLDEGLAAVDEALAANTGTTRRSLHAVRRKLADAVALRDEGFTPVPF